MWASFRRIFCTIEMQAAPALPAILLASIASFSRWQQLGCVCARAFCVPKNVRLCVHSDKKRAKTFDSDEKRGSSCSREILVSTCRVSVSLSLYLPSLSLSCLSLTDIRERRGVISEVTPGDKKGVRSQARPRVAKVAQRNSFLGKEQKLKHFLFHNKKSLLLLLSYLFFNSKDMTVIPGVYISTLRQ